MKEYILPKGTLVKHGTTLCQLPSIMKLGIKGGGEYRDENRVRRELTPEISGVYVGNVIAYFAAYSAYSSKICSELNFSDYQKALRLHENNPKGFESLEIPVHLPATLPIILNIRLAEDCILYADEDFVDDGRAPLNKKIPKDRLVTEAEKVWINWQTGCLVRVGGIPSKWIKKIEYPALFNLQNVSRTPKDLISDCDHLASGLKQSYLKKNPKPILKYLQKKYKIKELSNSISATEKEISNLMSCEFISNIECRLFNHLNILLLTQKIAEDYGVKLEQ